MLQFTLIGNLGMDAHVKEFNGRKFVAFDVAHTDRWTDDAGNVQESTIWVSCTLNGDGGNLLPYLTRGRRVCVVGDGSVRCYPSKVQRKMMAGANIAVRTIELLPDNSDNMPRQLILPGGELVDVRRYFAIDPAKAVQAGATKDASVILQSPKGDEFEVTKDGWCAAYKKTDDDADKAF